MTRALVILLLVLGLQGCDMLSVDYGHARWICVDQTLDDVWFDAIERASEDVWLRQYGATVKPTRDCSQTEHKIVPITKDMCHHTLDTPGTYFIDIGLDTEECLGVADLNETINVWHVGIAVEYFNEPTWNYYDRVYLAAHELGHVLGCDHTRSTGRTIVSCEGDAQHFYFGADLSGFTCDGEIEVTAETKPGIMHYGMTKMHGPEDLLLSRGDYEVCPTL